MKHLKKIICTALVLVLGLTLVACSKDNNLDLSLYLTQKAYYKLNGSTASVEATRDNYISSEVDYKNYSVIQLTTDKNWTYGLTLETVEFDVYLSEEAIVDIDITISNLENAANHNKDQDTFYYHKTLSFNSVETHVKLDINDVFINKASTISLEVNTSCYTEHPTLKLSVNNFKMSGFHKPSNY